MSAYRGYLIRSSSAGTWIERDGFLIGWAKSEEDARRIIREELTASNPTERHPSTHWVAFSTTKGGRRRAWRWSVPAMRWFPISVLDAEQGLARGDWKLTHMVKAPRPEQNPVPDSAISAATRRRRDKAEREWKRAVDELVAAWDRNAPALEVDGLRVKVEDTAARFDEAKAAELEAWRGAGRPVTKRRRNPPRERGVTADEVQAAELFRTLKIHETDFARQDLSGTDDATILSVADTRVLIAELTRLYEVEEAARVVAALNDDWSTGSVYVKAAFIEKNNAALARLKRVMRPGAPR